MKREITVTAVLIIAVLTTGELTGGQKQDLADKRLHGFQFAGSRVRPGSDAAIADTLRFFGCEARSSVSRLDGYKDACYLLRDIEGGFGFTIEMKMAEGGVAKWKGTIKEDLLEAIVLEPDSANGAPVEYQFTGNRIRISTGK